MKKALLVLVVMLSSTIFAQGQTTFWHADTQGCGSGTMAFRGVIQIDGVEQFSNDLELGIFYGDVCRGAGLAYTQY